MFLSCVNKRTQSIFTFELICKIEGRIKGYVIRLSYLYFLNPYIYPHILTIFNLNLFVFSFNRVNVYKTDNYVAIIITYVKNIYSCTLGRHTANTQHLLGLTGILDSLTPVCSSPWSIMMAVLAFSKE